MKPPLAFLAFFAVSFSPVHARELPDPPPDYLKLRVQVQTAFKSLAGSPRENRRARTAAKQPRTLLLHRYTVRAEDFRLRLWTEKDSDQVIDNPPAVRTYRGSTEEDPNERVVGVLYRDGRFQASASAGVLRVWEIVQPINVSEQVQGVAGTDDGRNRWRGATITRDPGEGPLGHFPPVRAIKRAQLGADITKQCVDKLGDWESALAWTEWQTSFTDEFYTRDLAISFEASETIVRLDRLHPEKEGGLILKSLSKHWKTKHRGENWDYVNAFRGPSGGVSGMGSPFSCGPIYHEIGHSMFMEHTIFGVDLQNPVNHAKALCRFEKRKLLEKFDDAPRPASDSPDPVHPYAAPDIAVTQPGKPVRIHVLGNDFDANNEPISINFYTEKTVPGGSVRKITHQEKSGTELDALEYSPPRGYLGKDLIIYSVQNRSGLHRPDLAHVYVIDEDARQAAHWTCDRIVKNLTEDAEKQRLHAKVGRGAQVIDGPTGKAIQLAPAGQIVCGDADLLPERPKGFRPAHKQRMGWYPLEESAGNNFDPLNLSYTAAFWVQASGYPGGETEIQIDGSTERETIAGGTLLEKANGSLATAVGFRIHGTPNGLQLYIREFTDQISGGEASKRTVTHQDELKPGTWHHVAMVIDRRTDTAALYLDGKKANNEIALIKDSWIFAGRSDLRLVSHPDVQTAYDDLRIAYRAFSSEEIQNLVKAGHEGD